MQHLLSKTKQAKEMVTYERIDQELNEAKEQHRKAEEVLKEFKEDENEGKWLAELKGKLRRKEGLDKEEKRAWEILKRRRSIWS